MENKFTTKIALEYYNQDKIEEWIHKFLCDEGHNLGLSQGLKIEKRYFMKPVKLPLNIVERCCGPEENIEYKVSKDSFEKRVGNIQKRLSENWDMPPLFVNYDKGNFKLNDGNHRYEALIRDGFSDYYMIIWITAKEDFEDFKVKYSKYYE